MDHRMPLRRPDGWIETDATIISCKETLGSSLRGATVSNDGYLPPPDYVVVFRYVVAKLSFTGKYEAHSEQAIGSTLTIAYDPVEPSKNTGTGLVYRPWIRIIVWTIGVGLAALAAYLGFPNFLGPY